MKTIVLPILEAKARVDRQNKDKKTALDLCKSLVIKQLLEMYLIANNLQTQKTENAPAEKGEGEKPSTPALPAIPGAQKKVSSEKAEPEKKKRLLTLWRVRMENLSRMTTGDLLEDHIRGLIRKIACPDPTRVDVVLDPITSRPRGWAYVDFIDAAAAELAVRGHGEALLGLMVHAFREGSVTMEYEEKVKVEKTGKSTSKKKMRKKAWD